MNNTTTITRTRSGKQSRCVESATYDHELGTLEIMFVSDGRTLYTYTNVTAAEWATFAGAPSLGVAFNRMFYGREVSRCAVAPMALAA